VKKPPYFVDLIERRVYGGLDEVDIPYSLVEELNCYYLIEGFF